MILDFNEVIAVEHWVLDEVYGTWIIGFMFGFGMPIKESGQVDLFFGIIAVTLKFRKVSW
jgi:hypothetical protein